MENKKLSGIEEETREELVARLIKAHPEYSMDTIQRMADAAEGLPDRDGEETKEGLPIMNPEELKKMIHSPDNI